MNVVDSSAWLEFFADGPNADVFASPILDTPELIVPTITLFEVFKIVLRQRGEDSAFQAIAHMKGGVVVTLDSTTALEAAAASLRHSLPMADSIIWATARAHGATIWTQDADFAGLDGVRYVPKSAGVASK